MRLVYVAHPLRGNPEANMASIEYIMQSLVEAHPGTNFFSPLHGYSYFDCAGPQDGVMACCLDMIDRADEVWFFGDWASSEGCTKELLHSFRKGKRVAFKSLEALNALEALETAFKVMREKNSPCRERIPEDDPCSA